MVQASCLLLLSYTNQTQCNPQDLSVLYRCLSAEAIEVLKVLVMTSEQGEV